MGLYDVIYGLEGVKCPNCCAPIEDASVQTKDLACCMSDYEFCEAELEEGDGVPVHALTLCPKCNAWIDINLVLKEFPKFVFGVVKSVEAKKK